MFIRDGRRRTTLNPNKQTIRKGDGKVGDWGLGIGDWGLGPIPNPQSPIALILILLSIKLVDFAFKN